MSTLESGMRNLCEFVLVTMLVLRFAGIRSSIGISMAPDLALKSMIASPMVMKVSGDFS